MCHLFGLCQKPVYVERLISLFFCLFLFFLGLLNRNVIFKVISRENPDSPSTDITNPASDRTSFKDGSLPRTAPRTKEEDLLCNPFSLDLGRTPSLGVGDDKSHPQPDYKNLLLNRCK